MEFNVGEAMLFEAIQRAARLINPTARAEQEGRHFHVSVSVAVCDFCTDRAVTHRIKATSFQAGPSVAGLVQDSCGDWAACDRCVALVQADNWDTLEDVVTAQLGEDSRSYLRVLYDGLRQHMTGEIVRVES